MSCGGPCILKAPICLNCQPLSVVFKGVNTCWKGPGHLSSVFISYESNVGYIVIGARCDQTAHRIDRWFGNYDAYLTSGLQGAKYLTFDCPVRPRSHREERPLRSIMSLFGPNNVTRTKIRGRMRGFCTARASYLSREQLWRSDVWRCNGAFHGGNIESNSPLFNNRRICTGFGIRSSCIILSYYPEKTQSFEAAFVVELALRRCSSHLGRNIRFVYTSLSDAQCVHRKASGTGEGGLDGGKEKAKEQDEEKLKYFWFPRTGPRAKKRIPRSIRKRSDALNLEMGSKLFNASVQGSAIVKGDIFSKSFPHFGVFIAHCVSASPGLWMSLPLIDKKKEEGKKVAFFSAWIGYVRKFNSHWKKRKLIGK